MRMDYEGNGKAGHSIAYDRRRARRCAASATASPMSCEVDDIPFAAMTPVIVTHRFFGRSIADLVMDIQRIKTALLRALLDNAYLANNPAHRGAGEPRHRDHARRSAGVAAGRDRAHEAAGGLSVIAASGRRRPRLPAAAIPGRHARVAHRRVAAGPGRRSQRAAEPGRDHRQPDVQRGAGQDEDDRAHLRRDRHPRSVHAAARHHPQARLAAADSAAAQPVGDGRSARLEGAQRHDHQCRAGHRQQDRATRALQHDHRRAGEGHRGRAGEPEEPLQFGQGAHQARGPQERRHVLHRAGRAAPIRRTRRRRRSRRRPIRRRRRRSGASSSRKPRPASMPSSARRRIGPTSR